MPIWAITASFITRMKTVIAHGVAMTLALNLMLFGPASPAHATQADDTAVVPYRMGIFPYLAPRQIIKFYGPVVADLEQVLHHPIKLESQRSFTDFTHALALHTYDIALIQPFDYPEVVEKEGYIPLARLSVPLVTQFYVRDDSPYHTLTDLRGTTIAMPPAQAANSRIALRALYDNQLIPGHDVKIRYFNSHDSCLQQVWVGNASACTSAPPPVKIFEKRMQANFRPIFATPPIPHVIFVAEPRVPARDRERLQQRILAWGHDPQTQNLLKDLGFPPFAPVQPGEYDVMHGFKPMPEMAANSAGNGKTLVLGIFPYLSTRQLVSNFAPLLPAFTEVTGKPVILRTASSFGSFSDNLAAGKYDIALVQPFEFERAEALGYIPLAGMQDLTYGGFFVKKDTTYKRISDFKGKTIAMAPAESAQSRLAHSALLKAGLQPGVNVTIKYVNTHDACLQDVQLGAAAACATSPLVLKMLPKDLVNNFRQVGETQKMPGVVFLAHPRLPAAVRKKLQQEILSWKDTRQGRKILDSMQFGNFVVVNPELYRHISRIGH